MSGAFTNQQIAKLLKLGVETINEELQLEEANLKLVFEAKNSMLQLVNQVISASGIESQIHNLRQHHLVFETLFQDFSQKLTDPSTQKKALKEALDQVTGTGIPNLFAAIDQFESALPDEPVKTSPASSVSEEDLLAELDGMEFDGSFLFAPKATGDAAQKPTTNNFTN